MTEHFIQTLPTLLHRYSADAEKLTNLLAIPQYFDLEVYTSSRLESNLQAFLDKMGDIMQSHNDKDVLETCAKTLEFLCTEGSAIYTRCDIARSNIIDQCVNRYKEAIDDWRNLIAGEETPNEDETYNIVISLKKVSILYSCHNLNPWNLFQSLYEDIDECQSRTAESTKGLPDEVNACVSMMVTVRCSFLFFPQALVYCIEACYFSIAWGLHHLENNCEASAQEEGSLALQRNLFKFMRSCTELVPSNQGIHIQEAVNFIINFIIVPNRTRHHPIIRLFFSRPSNRFVTC